ncbi:ketosteroid isomerase-like protein [Bradyrhizobium barranii subsp. barranii]
MGDLNSVIIRKAYEDFAIGSIPSVFAVFDAGITWHVPGHSPLSGDYPVLFARGRLRGWRAWCKALMRRRIRL